ncbi:putative transcription factor WD40-like family [Rosa chinensis]|uniref:Putative transcription factor WD40-like family n=1 Tax=Rosa chinensis TaxID=74649 RepID=A0A2P6SN03_ROSCH|nr:WD repeat-containing protein RUP2 [Rosa chinensis]PRQ60074.1 putative transcription factor WD40-like family [Rosa chinensis]
MLGYGSLWLVQKHPQCLQNLTSPPPPPLNHDWTMNPPFHFPVPQPFQNQNQTQNPDQQQVQDNKPTADDHHLHKSRFEWDFTLSTVVSSPTSTGAVSNTLGVIEFDPSETVLATGGIARKIRIYSVKSLLPSHEQPKDDVVSLDHAAACDYYICTPAKLSSLRWRPGSSGRVLGSGDYDGVVTEYDLESHLPIFERDEHGGRRVWSLDYSDSDPVLGASGSDDGTLQMWDPRCEGGDCVARVAPSESGNPVCCVEFNPFGGPLLAVGCADRKAYVYDVRRMAGPVLSFDGHDKTVTYVRFLNGRSMVSAGTDGCLKMWSVDDAREIRTYSGHTNNRSFVGLSVWRNGGLLGCGSENNQVFVYDVRWGEPVWVHGFGPMGSEGCDDRGFVSSVCWRQMGGEEQCTLMAGGSDGVLQLFVGRRKSLASD